MQAESKQWQAVRRIHADEKAFFQMAGGVGLFAVLGAVGLLVFAADRFGYQMNVYTELISVALTILVLDRRAAARAEAERKEELIFQMGSPEHTTAHAAARILKVKGWLEDGTLQRADLSRANLKGVDLNTSDLRRASL
ncbi:MAG: pentapeptide repeat-containing protein, partial [Chloroflexota bacterium]